MRMALSEAGDTAVLGDILVVAVFAWIATRIPVRSWTRPIYLLGVAALVVALSPPLAARASASVTAHMIQHLLLVAVAAPCLAIGLVRVPTRFARARWPRMSRAVLRRVAVSWLVLVVAAVHAVVIVAWHLPRAYDLALRTPVVHALEHATMLLTATVLWCAVVHRARRRAALVAVPALFCVACIGTVVGVFMLFAPEPLYAHGTVTDQQLAGVLMAGVGGIVYVGAATALVARVVNRGSVGSATWRYGGEWTDSPTRALR